jgi:hypothetical protein
MQLNLEYRGVCMQGSAIQSSTFSSDVPFSKFLVIAILLAVVALTATRVAAQATSGVTGVVTDPSGAVVVGATVTLTNPAIGFSATTKTNDIGVYEFLNVPPGENYSIAVSKEGFRALTLEKVVLNVGTRATQDAQLAIGGTQVSVEVTSRVGETLNTTDASLGSIIDADRVQDLPNIFVNDAANYLALAPGVTPGGAVTGTRSDQTNVTLDGLDVNDQRGGFAFTTTVNTPLDSIQELKATVTGDDTTYGHSAGGQLELVTKSGTNEFHGQAFDLTRATAYAANDHFNNLQGIPNPQLIRNQFGGDVGGPIRKDKLFFFISYNGLRAKQSQQINDVVPESNFYSGQLNYINTSGNVVTSPTSGPNSLTNLDPCFPAGTCPGVTPGPDAPLLSFLQSRGYPTPNNTAVGDGLNTAGFFFVAPVNTKDNTTIGRLDYQMTTNHRLFARATWDRSSDDDSVNHVIQIFPRDPAPAASIIDHSRSWVVGETWTASPNITNQASFGETDQVLGFPVNYKPTFPNDLSFFDGFFGSDVVTNPFLGLNEQFPNVPVYQARDTLTWTKGKHVLQFGGVIAPTIFKSGNVTDTTTYNVGLGNALSGLTSAQRPSDIGGHTNEWDRLYSIELGLANGVSAGYNYDVAGNALPQGGIPIRDYHSTQYEFFAQDTWQLRSNLTLTYGLRWQFHQPLSEVNGFESVPNLAPFDIFTPRLQDAAQGISGPDAIPFITYRLGGSANHGPDYYHASYKDFAPRIAFAYSPSPTGGFLEKLFGNRQSSIRAGFGIDFDNNLIGQGFELDETSFLFSNTIPAFFSDPTTAPRVGQAGSFGSLGPGNAANLPALPAPPPGGTTPRPTFTPNVDNGFPIGFFNGGFGQGAFFNFDPNYKTPYEMHFSFGIQRQLPGDWLVEATYVGKFGRRLTALGDPAQTLNFKDATAGGPSAPGQFLYDAFGAAQKQIQAGANPGNGTVGTPLTAQPWFENQLTSALEQNFGVNCPQTANFLFTDPNLQNLNCTNIAGALAGNFFADGDVSSLIQTLADFFGPTGGFLAPNVALLAQNGAAGYIGNYSSSNYHALIIRVNHKFSHDLTMEANYAYSHSIDNDSGVQNDLIGFSGSEICDLRNLRVCRGSSDFDHRHLFTANFIYGLPFGRGKRFGANTSKLLDAAMGGWSFSGITTAYTGAPFKVDSGAFTIDFTQTQPGVFIGNKADVSQSVHQVPSGQTGVPNTVQFFSNETNAFGAFTAPIAGGPGNRNILNGPNFWNIDMSLLKDFTMPWSEKQKLQFRADAFNIFNHTNFSAPDALLINPATFGSVTSTVHPAGTQSGARQLQLGLKYSF